MIDTYALDAYQEHAKQTYLRDEVRAALDYHEMSGEIYLALKLAEEAGEVAGKVGKAIRDDEGQIDTERRDAIIKELGDVLWYVATMADEICVPLSEVALQNIAKLRSRKERGKLGGDGDDR